MKTPSFMAALLLLTTQLPSLAQTDPAPAPKTLRIFQSQEALAAQSKYGVALNTARLKYKADLDAALKAAMAASNLDESNAINAALQTLDAETPPAPGGPFKTTPAAQARLRYETTVANARRLYGRELQQALKQAMSAANLTEANEINAEIKDLVSLLAASAPATPPPSGQPQRPQAAPGLQTLRYPRHPSQAAGDNYNGYVALTDLGKPLDAPQIVTSISAWTKTVDENAVASGFIKIEKSGTYEFRTDSDFDRNELMINNKIVCKFRDGPGAPQTVRLKAGLLPITIIAYANRTKTTSIQWKPPGQEWSEIPDDLLSH